MTNLLTPENLRPLLQDIVERMPNNVNPLDQGICVYEDREGNHCLIGQLAFEQGWYMPPVNWVGNVEIATAEFGWPLTNKSIDYLSDTQTLADEKAQQWGNLKETL